MSLHYRGDTPRRADFFHGKGDGSHSEDLTRCYNCGYETYKLMSHCPQCGRGMQSKRWSRRYGFVLLVLGLIITVVIGWILSAIGPKLLGASGSGAGLRFSGTRSQARLALGILSAVEVFGLTATCYGLWQVVTGRRSKLVIYFAIALCLLVFLVGLFGL